MVHSGTSTGRSTISGFDVAWFSSLSSELCVFALHGAIFKHVFVYIFLSLPFSELSQWDRSLT